MLPENEPIQGSATESGVSNETPASGGVAASATPAQPPVDVESLRAEFEKERAKFQNDLNSMKSSLQKQTAQVNADWQKRYDEAQRQIHETRMSTMTDDERARYESQLQSEEYQTLQSRLAELEQKEAQQVATVNAFNFFTNMGVPANRLDLSQGYEALVNAGWAFVAEELTQLRQRAANPQSQKPVTPNPLPQAPGVVTDKGTPNNGTTWEALRRQFGSDEAVYRAVEEGRIDPSVIPS